METSAVPNPTNLASFRRAENTLYLFTALQNAAYVIFILMYHEYMVFCDPADKHGVWLDTTVLFSAVLLGNLFSVYAGFNSDAFGHGRGIRKSFYFGCIHGLLLAVLPLLPHQDSVFSAKWILIFVAVLMQTFSSAFVNASYHSWFVASAHNLGYTGELDPYMSRRRLVTNLVWLVIGGLLLLAQTYAGEPNDLVALGWRVSVSGIIMFLFYALGAYYINKIIWSKEDLGSFESASTFIPAGDESGRRKTISENVCESFSQAWYIIRSDGKALAAASLFVFTWSLGIMVLYFWQSALAEHPASGLLTGWASAIWILMTIGRIVGNSLAVLKPDTPSEVKQRRLNIGGWLNGLSMVCFAMLLLSVDKTVGLNFAPLNGVLAVLLAILLIVVNRIGQEIVLSFALARLHETKGATVCQNRAALESFLAVWTSIPLILTWIIVSWIERNDDWKTLVIGLVFGFLGVLVVTTTLLNGRFVKAVYIPREAEDVNSEASETSSLPS